jgi:hypothetical protein
MNLNGDEKRIRQLFCDLSRDDERRAPDFASVIRGASSRTAGSRGGTRSLAFAWVAAVIFVALLIAVAITVRSLRPESVVAREDAPSVLPGQPAKSGIGPAQPIVETARAGRSKTSTRPVRHRRTANQFEIAMKSLFGWQSPTASLLKTPGEDMLKSLPRLGESLQTIKSFSPDEFN